MEDKNFFCLYCVDRTFPNLKKLSKHRERNHPDLRSIYFLAGSSDRQCPHCQGTYPIMSERNFLDHCRSCISNPERFKNIEKYLFACPYCSAMVARKDNLKKHISLVHSERPLNEFIVSSTSFLAAATNKEYAGYLEEFINGSLDPSHLVRTTTVEQHDTKIHGSKATRISFHFSPLALQFSSSGLFYEVIEAIFFYLADIHGAEEDDLMQTSLNSEVKKFFIFKFLF